MSYHLLKVDALLFVAPVLFARRQDGSPDIVFKTAECTVNGVRSYYYTGAGAHRFLIVMRMGEPLECLNEHATFVLALIDWDEGTPGLVLRRYEGQRHLRIKVDMVLTLTDEEAVNHAHTSMIKFGSLAEVLATAPRNDQPESLGWRRP